MFAAGACLHIERADMPTMHYGLTDGMITIEGEAAFELVPHMLVVAPANNSVEVVAAVHPLDGFALASAAPRKMALFEARCSGVRSARARRHFRLVAVASMRFTVRDWIPSLRRSSNASMRIISTIS